MQFINARIFRKPPAAGLLMVFSYEPPKCRTHSRTQLTLRMLMDLDVDLDLDIGPDYSVRPELLQA
jgi:hypothetical protein